MAYPRIPKNQQRLHPTTVLLTKAEKELLKKRAQNLGLTLSDFSRRVLTGQITWNATQII